MHMFLIDGFRQVSENSGAAVYSHAKTHIYSMLGLNTEFNYIRKWDLAARQPTFGKFDGCI